MNVIRTGLRCLLPALTLLTALCLPAAAAEAPVAQVEREVARDGALPAECAESPLGSLAAEAARQACGTQLTLLPAGILGEGLDAGALYESEVADALTEDSALCRASLSPKQLKELLEYGVARLVTNEAEQIDPERSAWAGFPQTASFTWTCDASAPAGERVLWIELEGQELDLEDGTTQLTLAAPQSMLDGSLGYPVLEWEATGTTVEGALLDYARAAETLAPLSGQVTVVGTSSYPLAARLPLAAIAGACILIALFSSVVRLKYKKHFTFEHKANAKPRP